MVGQRFLFCFLILIVHPGTSVDQFQKLNNFRFPPSIVQHLSSLQNTSAFGIALMFCPKFDFPVPFVVHYFSKRLPTNWRIVVFTHPDMMAEKRELLDLVGETKKKRELMNKGIHVFPYTLLHSTLWAYSCLLVSFDMYNKAPAKKILIFQPDTLVLQQDDYQNDTNPTRFKYLRDFYEFPYVGAPWLGLGPGQLSCNGPECRGGGNGGLSLRDKQAMVEATRDLRPQPYRDGCINEDSIISSKLITMEYPNLVPRNLSQLFSIETSKKREEDEGIPPSTPFPWGIHKVWLYDEELFTYFTEKHPELITLSTLHTAKSDKQKREVFEEWVRKTFLVSENGERILELIKTVRTASVPGMSSQHNGPVKRRSPNSLSETTRTSVALARERREQANTFRKVRNKPSLKDILDLKKNVLEKERKERKKY